MDEGTAYAINTMLQETIKSGTGTRANIGRAAAGKTGTTQLPEAFGTKKGNKDAWWAGYTPDIVGIVWMGYDKDYSDSGKPQYMVNVYGGQYPALVWKQVVTTALENVPESKWERPAGYDEKIDTSSSGTKTTKTTKTKKTKKTDNTKTDTSKEPTDNDKPDDSGGTGGEPTPDPAPTPEQPPSGDPNE